VLSLVKRPQTIRRSPRKRRGMIVIVRRTHPMIQIRVHQRRIAMKKIAKRKRVLLPRRKELLGVE
jgi:hypothetical protein